MKEVFFWVGGIASFITIWMFITPLIGTEKIAEDVSEVTAPKKSDQDTVLSIPESYESKNSITVLSDEDLSTFVLQPDFYMAIQSFLKEKFFHFKTLKLYWSLNSNLILRTAALSSVFALTYSLATSMGPLELGAHIIFMQYLTWFSYGADGFAFGEPGRLLGYPVLIAEDMPDIESGSMAVAFGDFRAGYTIAERPDLRVLRDPFSAKPHVLFYATKRVGGDVSDFAAIKLLKFAVS